MERFNNKEKMELQVLDKTGAALISSTGFVPAIDLNMEDFKRALQAGSNDRGVWTGKNANRENVMAYTLLERDQNGNVIGALRYVVSLTLVDRQVWILVGVMLLFGVVTVSYTHLHGADGPAGGRHPRGVYRRAQGRQHHHYRAGLLGSRPAERPVL